MYLVIVITYDFIFTYTYEYIVLNKFKTNVFECLLGVYAHGHVSHIQTPPVL